jgi:acyl carrier protein
MQSNGQTGGGTFEGVAEQVVSIIASVKHMPREKISLDSAFGELGLDSLDTVVLLSELEDHFKIAISNDEARSIVRVRDAVERIQLGGSLSCDAAP